MKKISSAVFGLQGILLLSLRIRELPINEFSMIAGIEKILKYFNICYV